VEQPVKQVDVAAQTVRCGVDSILVSQLAQQTEQHAAGAGDELAPQGGQHAALKHIARLSGVQNFLGGEHTAVPCQRPAQHIVCGDMIVVADLGHKGKARLPDAVFVMAQKSLRHSQIRSGHPLRNPPLFPQQGQGSGKFCCHGYPP